MDIFKPEVSKSAGVKTRYLIFFSFFLFFHSLVAEAANSEYFSAKDSGVQNTEGMIAKIDRSDAGEITDLTIYNHIHNHGFSGSLSLLSGLDKYSNCRKDGSLMDLYETCYRFSRERGNLYDGSRGLILKSNDSSSELNSMTLLFIYNDGKNMPISFGKISLEEGKELFSKHRPIDITDDFFQPFRGKSLKFKYEISIKERKTNAWIKNKYHISTIRYIEGTPMLNIESNDMTYAFESCTVESNDLIIDPVKNGFNPDDIKVVCNHDDDVRIIRDTYPFTRCNAEYPEYWCLDYIQVLNDGQLVFNGHPENRLKITMGTPANPAEDKEVELKYKGVYYPARKYAFIGKIKHDKKSNIVILQRGDNYDDEWGTSFYVYEIED